MNITMNESAIAEANRQMQKAGEYLESSYERLMNLVDRLETTGTWEGETQKAFIAYMDLMRQYHRSFTDENADNPVMYAVKAFTELLERSADFYTEFATYRYMEEIV